MKFPLFRKDFGGLQQEAGNSKCSHCGGSMGKLSLDNTDFKYCICHQQRSEECLRGFLTENEVKDNAVKVKPVILREELSTGKSELIDATSQYDRECELLTAVGQVDTQYDETFNAKKDLRRFLWAENGLFVGFIFWSYTNREEKAKPVIQQIFVEQGSQRTGVATKMVEKWIEFVEDNEFIVLDPNPLAYAFFEELDCEFEYIMQ
jgi:GNAT superfamily N-acetyltransferase